MDALIDFLLNIYFLYLIITYFISIDRLLSSSIIYKDEN